VPPPAPLVIKLSARRQTTDKAVLDLGKISLTLATCTYIFIQLIRLSYDSGTETAREPRAEAVGEQGIIMILCSLIKKVTRLTTSLSQKILEVTRLTLVLRVLGPRKGVHGLQLYRMDHRDFGEWR